MKKLLLLVLTFVCISRVYGQSIRLEKGKEFEINVHNLNHFTDYTENSNYTYAFKVLGKEGVNTLLDCRMVKAVLSNVNKNPVNSNELNSDSVRTARLNSSWTLIPLALLQQSFTVTVAPNGDLVKIDGVDEILQDASDRWVLNYNTTAELKNNGVGFVKSTIEKIFPQLPKQTIGYKSEWTGRYLSFNATAIDGALLYLAIVGKDKEDIAGSGIFNQVTGLFEQLQYKTLLKFFDINGKTKGYIDLNYKQKLRYGSGHYLAADTAWINMLVKTNQYFGKAFMDKMNFDSTRAFTYLRAHDDAFVNDPYYATAKLDLVQRGAGNNYEVYGKQLRSTPAKFLKGNEVHLFNKFSESMNTSADSAYEVSKYMYQMEAFNGLVQESYSQNFLFLKSADLLQNDDFKKYVAEKKLSDADVKKMLDEMSEKHAVTVTNSAKLLSMLHQDKNPLMQQKINPMYLWVNAKDHGNDKVVLSKTASAFMKMKDDEIKNGNGGRYALLFYKQLISVSQKGKAEALLQKTIENLERLAEDTLNKDRYAHKNILAYAWYLKYQAAKPADSVKALQYLSKAAQYSPSGNKEKAYVSFYDRVFLHSEESYRQQFIEKLFALGDNEQALKVFADHINSAPTSIDEMRKIYEQHFPDKKFKDFFAANILPSWQAAPDFVLKGIDGKERSLAEFKNHWLVIDFWGTWCPPCRDEMPAINVFNKELKDGKYTGVNFLSVACRDNAENVKAYLATNKFDIPAAMANETIEKLYNIAGYPSKILVSPEGKMLALKFGDDWAGTIKKFNDIYPVNN
ncbi:TlpA family protein disulfide reductase [Mucilaginibacter sp. SMC90]|uniref:TlpA family protein disulfide reductase n=1 Tax=Mucilaginibacter sp. SMC90 TaxID=2929803 RepID=UPI001FB1B577|nr:TlpA disulfide reductase family protein [Mucilaginibacter sp. SMC90]UOE50553.1 TlpA family protein disulfide reductase [Mucilaginibacter sp. SMC90]